jgi:hypothetical protein
MTRNPRLPPPEDQIIPDPGGEIARGEDLVLEWERANPTTLRSTLDWVDQLRSLFGDRAVDRQPWPGNDFRL